RRGAVGTDARALAGAGAGDALAVARRGQDPRAAHTPRSTAEGGRSAGASVAAMKIFDVVRARVDLGQPARRVRRGVVPEPLALRGLELKQLVARLAVLPQVLVDQRELELRLEI